MEQNDLFFSSLKDFYGGMLSQNDVHLFYYDICYDKEDGISLCYEWSDAIQSFIDANKITIEAVDIDKLPKSVEDNCIYFGMIKDDNDSRATALFRHLRNSVSHYWIGDNGKSFCMKDFYYDENKRPTKMTMIGKIDKEYFYHLIDFFFKQKAIINEQLN